MNKPMTDPDHIPAPSDHAPRKHSIQQTDDTLTVLEDGREASAWIQSDHFVEVRQ